MTLRRGNAWEYMNNDRPKCPHCDEIYSISDNETWQLYEEGTHTITCKSCRKSFDVVAEATFRYSTDEQPEPEPPGTAEQSGERREGE